MGDLSTTAFVIFLILMAIGAAAFVFAWMVARLARERAIRNAREGRGQRPWGGKDYDRFRTKYFDKERRARAVRDRYRTTSPPPGKPPEENAITDLEYAHRETLGLVGMELTSHILREAYKQRIREYHPDRVAALGIKIRVLAEEETKRINDAYRFLKPRVQD